MPTSTGTNINLFGDDTMLYATNIGTQSAANKIQVHTNILIPWLRDWNLILNTNKTDAIIFGRHRKSIKSLNIENIEILWHPHVKYLGVTLDNKLTFNKNAQLTVGKARQIRAVFYPILNTKSQIPTKTKLKIFQMYIRTILTYAGPS